ncbi:MAG: NAD(P)H-dependent oxidoreductase [Caulobacteraceae bacterium]
MKLLHIDSSILGAHSASRPIAAAVVERLRRESPGLEVIYRDLAAEPLPHLAVDNIAAEHPLSAMAGGGGSEASVESSAALEAFLAADVVVVSAPMYNFTVSSQLKAWIDRILVPGKTFRYGPEGVEGLAAGKRVIVAISRGGLYGPGAPAASAEHAQSYLRTVFGFMGVSDLEFIVAEGIQLSPEHRTQALDAALAAAGELRAA